MYNKNILNTMDPPLVELSKLAKQTLGCINLGQGVPKYSPPKSFFEKLSQKLSEISSHQYSPDPGLPSLRHNLAKKYSNQSGKQITENNVIVTPGANQAFINSLLTLANPGEQIGLLSPYYFNHHMACTLFGYAPIEIQLNSDFTINIEKLRGLIRNGLKVLVLVNPSNPAGIIYSKNEISQIRDCLEEFEELKVISDETYEHFVFNNKKHETILQFFDLPNEIVYISSFSKSFGIPGWRLGYYISNEETVSQSLKVQDTTVISASTSSQILGNLLLNEEKFILPIFQKLVETNYRVAYNAIEQIPWLENIPSEGAYYLFPKLLNDKNVTLHIARDFIIKSKVAITPGIVFGKGWENHFRLSFANVSPQDLINGINNLSKHKF